MDNEYQQKVVALLEKISANQELLVKSHLDAMSQYKKIIKIQRVAIVLGGLFFIYLISCYIKW